MIERAICEAAFCAAVVACDPQARVREAMIAQSPRFAGRDVIGIAVGKAALAMARGAGAVPRGIAVSSFDDGGELPVGWTKLLASHPEPDERSLAAGAAAIALVASARVSDVVLALISGGASSLIEQPAAGVTLEQLRTEIRALAATGATIYEINARRQQLSAIKGGKLAEMSAAPVVTLAVSDVAGDALAVIGSGPTFAGPQRSFDYARVIAPMDSFRKAIGEVLRSPGAIYQERGPLVDDVVVVAERMARAKRRIDWGEPTVRLPADRGEGGRAQQLALELAKRLRGGDRSAFIAGSDGIDGPPPRGRPAPAGAFIDGTTWDAIVAAGINPAVALARCDAGTALDAVGALVITGPTGINHADIMIVG